MKCWEQLDVYISRHLSTFSLYICNFTRFLPGLSTNCAIEIKSKDAAEVCRAVGTYGDVETYPHQLPPLQFF